MATVTEAAVTRPSSRRAWVLGGLVVASIAAQVLGLVVPYVRGAWAGGWSDLGAMLVLIVVPFVYLGAIVGAVVGLRTTWPARERRGPLVAVLVLAAAALLLLYLPIGPSLVWLAD